MAFTALTCLNHTIHVLLNSSSDVSTSILTSCPEIESLQKVVTSLHELLGSGNQSVIGDFDRESQEADYRLQDVIEEAIGGSHGSDSSERIVVVKHEIESFIQKAKMAEERYTALLQQLGNDDKEEGDVLPRTGLDSITSKMIGLEEQFVNIRDMLIDLSQAYDRFHIFSILGMAGIGKTALAKRIFYDPLIKKHFPVSAIVSIGPKHELKHIMKAILLQIMSLHDVDKIDSEEVLASYMRKCLEGKRYLIVLDDLWDKVILRKFIAKCPMHRYKGSRVLVTTRIHKVTYDYRIFALVFRVRLLNEKESWNLLLEKVFGNGSCPRELEKIGKKIIENCEGLPLIIIAIAKLLSKAEKTLHYWESVAQNANPLSIGIDDQTQITQTLLLSYEHLNQNLKPCFLYIAVFPQDSKIHISQLINLWSMEGFLGPKIVAMDYLEELVSNSVAMVCQQNLSGKTKTCKIHSAYWHVCIAEAQKQMLFHVMNKCVDSVVIGIENQRRLSVQNNSLLGIKEVRNSLASVSNAHSIICTGAHHDYPIPLCFGDLRLLRVLDALTIRFYEFPFQVLKLILLQYLSFTYNSELHYSIAQLYNLEILIIHRSFNMKSSKNWSYLPVEIWYMKKLRHLQVMGSDLPNPPHHTCVLKSLIALLDVSHRSCTSKVLGYFTSLTRRYYRIPYLEKLRIQIHLPPQPTDSLDIAKGLGRWFSLRSFKLVVTNPHNSMLEVVCQPFFSELLDTHSRLTKLCLSGLRYSWECIGTIGELPNLQVLKLQFNAFEGRRWVCGDTHFPSLNALLLEDLDLVQWEAESICFPRLRSLVIQHCYKLETIPKAAIRSSQFVLRIKLVDVIPSVTFSLKELLDQSKHIYRRVHVHVHSSWDNMTEVIPARKFWS